MVISETHADSSRVITLQPNRSCSWAQTRLFLLVFVGLTLAIGVFWASMGVWAVLPFSGLEAGLLTFLMYRVSQSTYERQRIVVSDSQVLIQVGSAFPRRTWRLQRQHTHLAVIEPPHRLDPPRVSIFDTRHNIEIGRFLNRDDKARALAELKRAGLFVRSHDRLARATF